MIAEFPLPRTGEAPGMLHRLWTSIVGIRQYRSLIAAGAGRAVAQILFLVLALVFTQSVSSYRSTRDVLGTLAERISGWPDFGLADGRFEFSGPMPFVAEQGDTAIIIDTEGGQGRELLAARADGILITGGELVIKRVDGRIVSSRWADLPFSTSRDRLARALPGLLWPIAIGAGLCKLIWHAAAKGVAGVILGLLGLLAAGGSLRFNQAFTIGLCALTGPVLLSIARAAAFPSLTTAQSLAFFLAYWGWAAAVTIAAAAHLRREAAASAAALIAAADERDDDGEFNLI